MASLEEAWQHAYEQFVIHRAACSHCSLEELDDDMENVLTLLLAVHSERYCEPCKRGWECRLVERIEALGA